MTTTVHVSTQQSIFEELRQELVGHSGLKLDEAASKEFQDVIEKTVGNYVSKVKEEYGEDIWQDKEVRKFAHTITHRIARTAKKRGGAKPSASVIREAANDEIRKAHGEFCEKLPPAPGIRDPRARGHGPMCDMYLQNLDAGT